MLARELTSQVSTAIPTIHARICLPLRRVEIGEKGVACFWQPQREADHSLLETFAFLVAPMGDRRRARTSSRPRLEQTEVVPLDRDRRRRRFTHHLGVPRLRP